MESSRSFSPLLYSTVASLMGGGLMLAVVQSAMFEPPADRSEQISAARSAPALVHRLAFAPPGGLEASEQSREPAMENLAQAAPVPQAAPATPVAGASAWSTEVRSEPQAVSSWRLALLPTFRLPSQIVKPAVRQRPYTLKERLAEISNTASMRIAAKFEAVKIPWPPAEIALVAIKDEKQLELHARPWGGTWTLVHKYRVLAASGGLGPKLRQGDKQVPEGIYAIAFLNPNSAYHVSLKVNYPNAFDRQMATKDGRKELGGDIMIHGKNLSAGCLAMGDEAVEELFVLAAQIGLPNVKLIIAPTDFRLNSPSATAEPGQPEWLPKLYSEIKTAMAEFKPPAPRSSGLLSFFTK